MTTRISLRPAQAAAVLITFVALVLTLLSVAGPAFRAGPAAVTAETARVSAQAGAQTGIQGGALVSSDASHHVARSRPVSTVSPVPHRSSRQTTERRVTATAFGHGADIHVPGGSPDVPATLTPRTAYRPTDLADLPVDALAEVVATTVLVAHRGRAPPASGFGVQTPS